MKMIEFLVRVEDIIQNILNAEVKSSEFEFSLTVN